MCRVMTVYHNYDWIQESVCGESGNVSEVDIDQPSQCVGLCGFPCFISACSLNPSACWCECCLIEILVLVGVSAA